MKNNTNVDPTQNVLQLDPALLMPNPWNRKHFNAEALDGLAASILAVGILEPIIARPIERKPDEFVEYEIIAGERRWRAAQQAGLPWVPVLVRDVDERGAREAHAIENLQREDLNAVEEGENYRQLLTELGCKVEDLEERLGRKRSHIYSRLRLADLPGPIKDAIIQGKLEATIGSLLSSIPDEKQQLAALEDVLTAEQEYDEEVGSMVPKPMSFRRAKDLIEREYRKSLKDAPFDTDKDYMLPVGGDYKPGCAMQPRGACVDCPHLTGNIKGLPSGSNPYVCTQPSCYVRKVDAHQRELLAPYQERGETVIVGKAAAKLWQYGGLAHSAPYVREDYQYWLKGKEVPIQKLLGKAMPLRAYAVDPKGKVVGLVRKDEVDAALIAAGVKNPPETEKPKPESAAELAKRRMTEEAEVRAADNAVTLLLKKLEGAGADDHVAAALQFIIETFDTADGFNHEVIARRRGLDTGTHIVDVAARMKQWPFKLGLLLEGFLADPYNATYEADWIEKLAKRMGVKVDFKALEKEALAQLQAEAQAKQPAVEQKAAKETKAEKPTKATKPAKVAKAKKGKARK